MSTVSGDEAEEEAGVGTGWCDCGWVMVDMARAGETRWLTSTIRLERVVRDRKSSWWSGTSRRVLSKIWLVIWFSGCSVLGRLPCVYPVLGDNAPDGGAVEVLFGAGHDEVCWDGAGWDGVCRSMRRAGRAFAWWDVERTEKSSTCLSESFISVCWTVISQ